ncbi:hypothetical protein KM043_013483 [Ampulex compressa]|nr:hypothetical protein KM043_013483 [Ampulex compressa]
MRKAEEECRRLKRQYPGCRKGLRIPAPWETDEEAFGPITERGGGVRISRGLLLAFLRPFALRAASFFARPTSHIPVSLPPPQPVPAIQTAPRKKPNLSPWLCK